MEKDQLNPQAPLSALSAPPPDAPGWLAFVKAAFQADHACYSMPADQVDFERLSGVMAAFPQGFRVYLAGDIPVGYTGWYPVAEDVFKILHDAPEKITHRGFMKPVPLAPEGNWIYLFNYSVIPALRGTEQSRALVKSYATEIKCLPQVKGMAAVTVSEDGARIAHKFGMTERGIMTHDGAAERVYTTCL